MVGKVLEADQLLTEDNLGCMVGREWVRLNSLRQDWLNSTQEVRQYLYATDTRHTRNSQNPWRNSTTIPKLCQIADNLKANYWLSLFPKRKNTVIWEPDSRESASLEKAQALKSYSRHIMANPGFKDEMRKLIDDYVEYGNCFASVEWDDQRVEWPEKVQTGYVGPTIRRWSPLDVVMNPVSPSFEQSPKILRSLVSIGEVKDQIEKFTTDVNADDAEALYDYLIRIRARAAEFAGDVAQKDNLYKIDGFTSFKEYLGSNYCEILTFYGDFFDPETKTFLKNHVITVVDRHKVISKRPHESWFGRPPIFHIGWRKRQDNLWAMGPLNNLVGMQYRIDQIENLKADVFDMNAAPPLVIKGYVDKFEWKPFARLNIGEEGDITPIPPSFQILQANIEIQSYMDRMEEMAGSPKEAMGFRTPGEKTKYEVQRLENAASRVYQHRTSQFEEFEEKLINACIECGRRNFTSNIQIKIFDRDEQIMSFLDLAPEDITGAGRVRPVAARHFAEQAERIQNLTAFYGSAMGQDQDILMHLSSQRIAEMMMHDLLDFEEYEVFRPNIRIAERAEAQKMSNILTEQVQMELGTPSGIGSDFDPSAAEPGISDEEQMVPAPPV